MSSDAHHPTRIPSKESLLYEIQERRREHNISELELGEEIGLSQSQVSKLLSGNRRLLYDEAHSLMMYLASRFSSIPKNVPVTTLMIPSEQIIWASNKDRVKDLADKMFEHRLQQVIVRSEEGYIGVVTLPTLLHGFLFPPENEPTETWIMRFKELTIDETGLLENIPEYSEDASLHEIFQVLMNENAVLLKKREKITGMITRRELLQLAL
ncbi:MAG: helix-turn-helix domain-containing protein [Candidatus Bathyarchaeota archaeon]|nr:helix-turn-helix domain-containing protein [Candidatus Bathyarchaeota archaeon]